MNRILKILLFGCFISLVLGPLSSISVISAEVKISFLDISTGLLSIFWILNLPKLIIEIKKENLVKYTAGFMIVCLISLIFSPIPLETGQKLISFLYLFRYVSYFSVYLTVKYLINNKLLTGQTMIKWLGLIGIILAVLGWLQYFLYPDLRNLEYLGWDPHFKRIFATYFDPNYFGLILDLSLIALLFIFSQTILLRLSQLFIFITLAFTYSRSSYVALLIGILYFSIAKRKFALFGIIFFTIASFFFILPRGEGEGVNLLRVFSIEDRIANWYEGWQIFTKNPILGVGFNTVRYAKQYYGLGGKDLSISHSGAGFENSFLFIAVSTGAVGLTVYLWLLWQFFKKSQLIVKISLAVIVTHSLFLNSLFFPCIMFWLWLLLALEAKKEV